MSRTFLVLAITLGGLPACTTGPSFAAPRPQTPSVVRTAGECRPDIGPGGILKIHAPSPADDKQKVEMTKIPNDKGELAYLMEPDGTKTTLEAWTTFTITVDFKKNPPEATVQKGAEAPKAFKVRSIQLPFILGGDNTQRVLLVDNVAGKVDARHGDKVFAGAALLHVFGAVPDSGGKTMYVTTVPISEK